MRRKTIEEQKKCYVSTRVEFGRNGLRKNGKT